MLSDVEMKYPRRCIELAAEALEAGDTPFGSVHVDADDNVLAENRNLMGSGDATRFHSMSYKGKDPFLRGGKNRLLFSYVQEYVRITTASGYQSRLGVGYTAEA